MLEESAEAENAVRSLASEPRGLLRVTLPLGVAMTFVYPHMHEFSEQYPLIELDLQVNDRTIDLVENRFDLALRVGHMKDSDMIARLLMRYDRVLCASPAYLHTHGAPKIPNDLSEHQCLLYQHDLLPVHWDFWIDGISRKVRVNGKLRSNESNALLTWARCGHGITRQPTWLVAEDLQQGRLVSVLDEFKLKKMSELPGIYAILPKARSYPAKVEAFLKFMSRKIVAQ
jgi:DNA-binding transcriptional LysR family regulator